MKKGGIVGALLLVLTVASCGGKVGEFERGSPATLEIARSCAPAGWTAEFYPYGASDIRIAAPDGKSAMRLFAPESVVAGKAASSQNPRAVYTTHWWRDVEHEEEDITLADGRIGKRYRSTARLEVTTEFSDGSGTWQLYGAGGADYEAVLRCVVVRLAQARDPGSVPSAVLDAPRSSFPSGAEGTVKWAQACFTGGSGGLQLLPDLAYISAPATTQWWETAATERTDLRFGSGGAATEMRAKDPNDPRVAALLVVRGQRWVANGRKDDTAFRSRVECAHRRISTCDARRRRRDRGARL